MFAMLSPMLWRAIGAAVLLAALAWAYNGWAERQRNIGRDEVRAEWQADKLAMAETGRILRMAADRESAALQAAENKRRSADNAQKHALELRLAESLRRLRNRPDRPAVDPGAGGVPETAGVGAAGSADRSCTGEGLFRPDGEFLAREAADANRLRIALATCRARYQDAVDTVNKARDAGG